MPEPTAPKAAHRIDAVPRAGLEGFQWNPMARFGEFLLSRYALSPGTMWIVLQLGGLVAYWVFMRLAFIILTTIQPLFEAMAVPVQGVRGCIYMTVALFILSSHFLWRDMNSERQRRVLAAYVDEGRNPEMFAENAKAQKMRAQVLSARVEKRRAKNRASRRSGRHDGRDGLLDHRKRTEARAMDE